MILDSIVILGKLLSQMILETLVKGKNSKIILYSTLPEEIGKMGIKQYNLQ